MNILSRRRDGGFSLVELMVSVVIGLLALLFATRLVISGEANKDAAVGGSDAMQNGMLALFSLSGDAGVAGWGLNDRYVAGCNTLFSDTQGYALPTAKRNGADITPLAAVVIQSNGAGPDVISFNSGSSNAGVASLKMTADYDSENFVVGDDDVPYGYTDGDVLVVASKPPAPLLPGELPKPERLCSVMQMSGFNTTPGFGSQMMINSGGQYRYNKVPGMAQKYEKNVTYMYNLGRPDRLRFHTWSVRNGILMLRAADLAGAQQQGGVSVVDNVVSIKAQYGFDTRVVADYDPNPSGSGPEKLTNPNVGMQIGRWSADMINADGDPDTGGTGDYQRIAAVRIAVVARSKTTEKPNAAGECSATTERPTVFATAAPFGVAAVPVQVDVTVPGDPINWKCYRYRVFETIVPLINSQYRP